MDVRTYELIAGVEYPVNQSGMFLKLVRSAAPLTLWRVKNSQRLGEVSRNVLGGVKSWPSDWKDDGQRFDGFVMLSDASQTVIIATSNQPGDYNRVEGEFGVLQTFNGEFYNRDLNVERQLAYLSGRTSFAIPAQYSVVDIKNEPGSGITVLIDKIVVAFDANADWELRVNPSHARAFPSAAANKRIGGGPLSKATLDGSSAGALSGVTLHLGRALANRDSVLDMPDPVFIPENFSIAVWCTQVNVRCWASYQWREV